MKPLLVLLTVFLISIFTFKFLTQNYNILRSARIGMCAMLFFTAIGHFIYTKGMTMMIPSIIPLKTEIVYLTAILEIGLGIGLLIPNFKVHAAWILIVFFILILPANIHAALKHIDYQKGTFDGNGLPYLWFRISLQIFFIVWTYLCTLKIE